MNSQTMVYCIPTTQELRHDAQVVLLDADADPYSPETKNWVNDTMGMLTGKAFNKIDFLEASKEPSTQLLRGRLNGGVYVAQVPAPPLTTAAQQDRSMARTGAGSEQGSSIPQQEQLAILQEQVRNLQAALEEQRLRQEAALEEQCLRLEAALEVERGLQNAWRQGLANHLKDLSTAVANVYEFVKPTRDRTD